ncbi:hypothetical protein Syun_010586 [Stephania yunnanensis]|uniref:Uncharacterized protein n=1 Tax=Stephania yunnanensis TaxID=152371 RepID=A0AAP0KGS6_9MAGN
MARRLDEEYDYCSRWCDRRLGRRERGETRSAREEECERRARSSRDEEARDEERRDEERGEEGVRERRDEGAERRGSARETRDDGARRDERGEMSGSDAEQQVRSPLAERLSLDPLPQSPSLFINNTTTKNHLPPLKFYSGLLAPPPHQTPFPLNFDDEEDDNESVASANFSDALEEEEEEEEEEPSASTDDTDQPSPRFRDDEQLFDYHYKSGSSFNRGSSKEGLRIQLPGSIGIYADANSAPAAQQHTPEKATPLGTPSAPPILEITKQQAFQVDDGQPRIATTKKHPNKRINGPIETKAFSCAAPPQQLFADCQSQQCLTNKDHDVRTIPGEAESDTPLLQSGLVDQKPYFNISSSEVADAESSSTIYLQPGTGDYHVFFTESLGDSLVMEVQDANRITQGRATVQLSSLTDNPNDKIRWWPIYHDDHECVGKVQLFVGSTVSSDENNPVKSGPVVETLAYDLVLESAMRSHNFHHRNLRIHGPWKWLLAEFSDYYGVSDTYTKLRYLSYVMNVATPTKDCLELVYELLVPVIKAKSERSLSRQEKSLLLDCETQVEKLLARVFENYKSLDEGSPSGLTDLFGPMQEFAAPALAPAVQTAATKRCRRHMVETDEFMSMNTENLLLDHMAISTAYLKMKNLCTNISTEIQADIKIHNQHILPSSIDLSNISAAIYSTELCKRLRAFLASWPPSSPLPHVTELLMVTADFERDLEFWNIRPVHGGVDSRNIFHNYIMVWIQDKQLCLLDLCKAEKVPWNGATTNHSTSPFADDMYEKIKDTLSEYEVVINRWPQYSLVLENVSVSAIRNYADLKAVSNIERAILKALERQYNDILTPLKDSIPKKLGMHVQKFTRRQSVALYSAPNELGTFMNTLKRILDVLHCRVEDILKPWASYLPVVEDKKSALGEQMNGVTVLLRTKYKNYMQAIVEKFVSNMQSNRSTRLKRILEETKEADGEVEVRERMHVLSSQIMDCVSNLHEVFSSRIFVAICRGFWDRMGQIVLKFLESRKENRVWYNGSYYALGVLDDTFASQMQRLQGNALQEKDIEPPRSIVEARSILCRDNINTMEQSTYLYF